MVAETAAAVVVVPITHPRARLVRPLVRLRAQPLRPHATTGPLMQSAIVRLFLLLRCSRNSETGRPNRQQLLKLIVSVKLRHRQRPTGRHKLLEKQQNVSVKQRHRPRPIVKRRPPVRQLTVSASSKKPPVAQKSSSVRKTKRAVARTNSAGKNRLWLLSGRKSSGNASSGKQRLSLPRQRAVRKRMPIAGPRTKRV